MSEETYKSEEVVANQKNEEAVSQGSSAYPSWYLGRKERESQILDIGCGLNKQPGAYGVDSNEHADQDTTWDLEQIPWPFEDDSFVLVYALQVLEHLEDRVATMREIYRVSKHGALVVVSVPDGLCAGFAQDPTHKHPWSIGTFLYFCPDQWPRDWDEIPPYAHNVKFRIYDFFVHTGESRPYEGKFYRDDLRVYLQVIKNGDS